MQNDVVEAIARALIYDSDLDPDVFKGVHGSYGHFADTAQAALAAIEASGRVVVPVGEPASMWRNAITNTVALIDIVRRRHKITPTNKAFAVFDCDLNGALDDWFKATRNMKPATYDEAEKAWKDFTAMLAARGDAE